MFYCINELKQRLVGVW